ncbi:MAG: hypothetical protein H0W62_00805 [Chitinophagales bacterium]|nr:hypothetical protein [Chitinophagales bacterium]
MKKMQTLLLSILIISATKSFAQTSGTDSTSHSINTDSTLHSSYLKIFIDGIPDWQDYVKVKMWYADYVRDPKLSQVQVVISLQPTASGGQRYSLFFLGRERFDGKNDTLSYTAALENTKRQTRDELTNVIMMGLMPYFALNGQGKYFGFEYTDMQQRAQKSFDKWNYWIFTLEVNPDIAVDASGTGIAGDAVVSAARVTDDWKIRFTGDAIIDYNSFKTDTLTYKSTELIKLLNSLVVKSVNDHWSLGAEAGYYSSSFSNISSQFQAAVGGEYDLFPYNQSVNHLLTFRYRLQPFYTLYNDTTIYNKTGEFLLNHIFDATYTRVERWGNFIFDFTAKEYVNHPDQFRLDIVGAIEVRLAQGLFLNLLGNYSYIRNQRDISNVGLSPEEIVLQHRELQTNYSYGLTVGISYTFGAIYNNIVNPRYESGIIIDPEIANILNLNLLGQK